MKQVVRFSSADRAILFQNTAAKLGLPPAIVEKDFWVCWALDYLFHSSPWSKHFAFKGGTSLSKCYSLIQRFSEDIDLILDWRLVGCEKDEPWMSRSKNQQDKYNKAVNARTGVFLAERFVPQLTADFRKLLQQDFQIFIEKDDPQTVCFAYPCMFSDGYNPPVVRMEIGPLAAWTPTQIATITPFVSELYPQLFVQHDTSLPTVTAERTFWEKATILHKIAFRTDGKIPPRYSRHYYDLWCMANSPVKDAALQDLDLLRKVVEFKDRFYPAGTAHYDSAKPGSLRLVPPVACVKPLCDDYEHMKNMIFGPKPEFDEILASMAQLEKEINQP